MKVTRLAAALSIGFGLILGAANVASAFLVSLTRALPAD